MLKTRIKRLATRVLFRGHRCDCNVCGGSWRRFLPEGVVPRPQARCPGCDSLERHRLTWAFFQARTNLFDGRATRMLHVAPERCFRERLQPALEDGYVTADLNNPADHRWDVTAIPQPDASFDVVYCSHVLEHIPDDVQAMREFHRVLAPDGWAVLNVPVNADVTDEDPSVTDPEERLRRFGQEDHVRRYGPDYVDRLRSVGFRVETIRPSDLFSDADIDRHGLRSDATGDVYYCTK